MPIEMLSFSAMPHKLVLLAFESVKLDVTLSKY